MKNFPWAYTRDRKPVRAGDLKAQGAMTALEKVALDIPSKPDMRQRLTQAGFEMTAKDGKSHMERVASELPMFRDIIAQAGIKKL